MFTALYDVVFPFLGQFFGKLTGFASISVGNFINLLTNNATYYSWTNVFTGYTTVQSIEINDFLNAVLWPLRQLLRLIFTSEGISLDTPLWAALLILSVLIVIVLGVIQFFRRVI